MGPKNEQNMTRGRALIHYRCQRASREATEASVGARKSTQVSSRDAFGDEKEADIGPEGDQKGVQIGVPEEEQNRALAAARAQSSMSEDIPNGASKLGCSPKASRKSLRSPRKHCKKPSWHQKGPCPAMGEPGQHEGPSPRLGIYI